MHQVATVASVLQLLRLPDGTVKVLVEGQYRARILRAELADEDNDAPLMAEVEELRPIPVAAAEASAMVESLKARLREYVELSSKVGEGMIRVGEMSVTTVY